MAGDQGEKKKSLLLASGWCAAGTARWLAGTAGGLAGCFVGGWRGGAGAGGCSCRRPGRAAAAPLLPP